MKYFALFFLLFYSLSFGQESNEVSTVKVDTSSIVQKRPQLDGLNERYSGEEFNYDIKTGESQNLLARFFRWLDRWLGDTFGFNISPEVFNILKWVIYVLMGALIIYLLVKLLINERFDALFTKKAKTISDIELAEQHIEQVNFEALLNKAIKEKEFRLAVRYQFLLLLKRLSQRELIDWHFEKTNLDYQKEIQEPQLKTGFKDLAYLYDYIWYGEQLINEQAFFKAKERFDSINQIIPE